MGNVPQYGVAHLTQRHEIPTGPQELVCYYCLRDAAGAHVDTPRQIVMIAGYSVCVPHARNTMAT